MKWLVAAILVFLLIMPVHAIDHDKGFHTMGSYALSVQYGVESSLVAGVLKEALDNDFDWEDVGANLLGLVLYSLDKPKNSNVTWEPLPCEYQDFHALVEKITCTFPANHE